jgi:GTP cyclohydrolase I
MQLVPPQAENRGKQNGHSINGHAPLIPSIEMKITDEMKIKLIGNHFREIMNIIGLDVDDDGLRETPNRVARLYVKEMFSGLNPANKPSFTVFENKYKNNKIVIEKNITLHSFCEHHFLPIIGKAHVAYVPNGKIIGLSKLNRIVQFHSKKPQVQERLTDEIAVALKEALKIQDVAVMIEATHLCVAMRGVNDVNSSTITSHFGGKFQNEDLKAEFLLSIR